MLTVGIANTFHVVIKHIIGFNNNTDMAAHKDVVHFFSQTWVT